MIYIGITAVIFMVDFGIKYYIEQKKEYGQTEEILGGKLLIRKIYNKGAIMNLLEKKQQLVAGISCGCFLMLLIAELFLIFQKGFTGIKLGLSFILGGALSNLYDRLVRKYVVDYCSFNTKIDRIRKIVFNLSDLFIFLGALITIISSFKKSSKAR